MKRRGRPSAFTPELLITWRDDRRLTNAEMADLLGMVLATLKSKLQGRRPVTLRFDRQINNIDLMVARGIPPDGSPDWLRRQILAGFGWHGRHIPR